MGKIRTILICSIVLVVILPLSGGNFLEWGPDLEGPWCATRPVEQCCPGRDDKCTVPILGTVCYCDIFCNETAEDCCPDFWNLCLGVTRPTPWPVTTLATTSRPPVNVLASCIKDGIAYNPGSVLEDNCNKCKCLYLTNPYARYEWNCTNHVCMLQPDLIRDVNEGFLSWNAGNYSDFWGMTLNDGVNYRLGTFPLDSKVARMTSLRVQLDEVLPESFDARVKWKGLINPVRDQGNCGASWAFSTTAVASDRLAIESEGAIKDELSSQHMISCNIGKQKGCKGGNLDRAWWYLRKVGVVTEECYPYTSGFNNDPGVCLILKKQKNGTCPSKIAYKDSRRYRATPPYRIAPIEREIMKEIMDNGPVQATFIVKQDFYMYKSGIYRYSNLTLDDDPEQSNTGYHSVRIVGWGVDRTIDGDIFKYWICANSWGTKWGKDGYFNILRGSNECEIEKYIVGVWGKISGDAALRRLLSRTQRRRLRGEKNLRNLRHPRRSGRKRRNRKNRGGKKKNKSKKNRRKRKQMKSESS
ncbi:uncharacterized peptidase C1-like protein F26E4.3 [Patella vulgata]|uniref:uncharacterized peptidase C1-like protein F26E4.3 n=1 Tax=Patella vulgata TaxID=6465 RepID=UPI00217FBCF2|nr:uncharacterized peptidase C1-like protein F26E4.3 [Patella vulgata]